MKTTITPHENEGRKYLLVGGIPIDAIPLGATEFLTEKWFKYSVGRERVHIELPEGNNYTLLGTIHTEGNALVFSGRVDPEVLVEKVTSDAMVVNAFMRYKNYLSDSPFNVFNDEKESVLSLLESKGYTMLNPYGEKEPGGESWRVRLRAGGDPEWVAYQNALDGWRTSESNRYKFKVAVIEVNQ